MKKIQRLRYITFKELRKNYWSSLLACLIVFVLSGSAFSYGLSEFTVSVFLSELIESNNHWVSLGFIIAFTFLIAIPISIGNANFFLNTLENNNRLSDLLFAFQPKRYWKIVFFEFVRYIMLVPFLIIAILILFSSDGSARYIIAAIFIAIAAPVYYRYRFLSYMLVQHHEMGFKETFTTTSRLIEEKRWELFKIDVSFGCLFFAASIIFGIGGLLILPYYEGVIARYYSEYKQADDENVVTVNKHLRRAMGSAQFLIVFVLTTLTLLSFLLTNAYANDIYVTTEEELRAAFLNDESVIVVNATIQLTEGAIEVDREVTIQGTGIIEVTGGFQHFIVQENANFTLTGDLTLQSAIRPSAYAERSGGVYVFGVFNMHGGVITNNVGRGVAVHRGTFNMYGGSITHNQYIRPFGWEYRGSGDGGVSLRRSTFNMHGGLISYNTMAPRYGGGGVFAGDSVINIYGGEISYNVTGVETWNSASELYLFHSYLTLYNGKIIGDHAQSGYTIALNGWESSGSIMYDGIVDGSILIGSRRVKFTAIQGEIGRIYTAGSWFDDNSLWTPDDDHIIVSEQVVMDQVYSVNDDQTNFRIINYFRQPYIHIGAAFIIIIYKLCHTAIFFKEERKKSQLQNRDKKGEVAA